MNKKIELDVIILNYNTSFLLEKCLISIFEKKWQYQINVVVVDNGSVDNSLKMVKSKFPEVKIFANKENLGFSSGNNVALKNSNAKYCLLLNSDTKISENSLDQLVDFMEETNFAIASCKLFYPDGSFQPNTGDLPLGISLFSWISGVDDLFRILGIDFPSYHRNLRSYYKDKLDVGWVSGTAMMIKRDVLDKVGYLDDKIFMYGEDVEICFRARKKGFKVGWTNKAEIVHIGGGSFKNPQFSQWLGEFKGLLYLYKKNYGFLANVFLRISLYLLIPLRIVVFLLLGKLQYSLTYAKLLPQI